MLNISTFYKRNKARFQSTFDEQISSRIYTDNILDGKTIKHVIQEVIRASFNNKFFASEAFKRTVFDFEYATNFITLLCTINNLYIHPYNMNAIHLSNGYDVYIIPKKKYIKDTVLLVDKSLVLAGGILKDNTIIWDRKIRLDKVCFMYIDIEKHPEVYTNEIMANVILNNLR